MHNPIPETEKSENKKQGVVDIVIRFFFDKYILATFIVLAFLIFQKELVYKLNFFDNIKPSPEADLLFLIAFVGVFMRYSELVFIRNYIFSRNYERGVLVVGFIYLVFRLILIDYWTYTPLDCINYFGLVYADFIVLLVLIHAFFEFIPRIINKCFSSKSKRLDKHSQSIFAVEHEGDNNNDSYGRKDLASLLAKEVYYLKSERSIAVGITGPWGTGKTWFMSKINSEIKKIDSTIKVLEFNSWLPDSENGITRAFFQMLKAELSTANGNLGADIDRYIKSISNFDKSNFTSAITDFFRTSRTLKNELDDIAKVISQTTERIIIIIDDLDRLNENELSEVLQILRSTEEFKNVIFIVGYDKQYITKAIYKINEHNHTQYLEKIFQIEISLPVIPSKTLFDGFIENVVKILENKIEDKFAKSSFIIELKSFFEIDSTKNSETYAILQRLISNKRDLLIFQNNILLSLIYLQDERISVRDLILIELLKIKFFVEYEALKINKFDLLELNNLDGVLTYRFTGNDKVSDVTCIRILNEIFNNPISRGLSDLVNFDLYFHAKSSIPFYRFYDLLKGDLTELIAQVDKWISESKTDELITLIERTQTFDNKTEYINVLEMCLYLIQKGKKFDYFIVTKLFDEEIINEVLLLYNNDRKTIFKDLGFVLRRYPKISLIGVIVNQLFETSYSEFVKPLAIDLLEYNISTSQDYLIIEKSLISCKAKQSDGKRILDGDGTHIFKEYVLKYPDLFIKNAIRNFNQTIPEFEMQTLFPFTEQVFGSYSEFESLLNEWKSTPELSELRTFYRRFKANNYQPIKFERGTIEFVSDSSNQFIKSDFFYKSGPRKPASTFIHPSWHQSVVKIDNNFNGLDWIAKETEISDMQEVRKGDCYYFERKVDLNIFERQSIKHARIKFMVDDVLSIKLNGKFICEGIITADTKVQIVDIDTQLLLKNNMFEFHVINAEGAAANQPSDNPYGLIYILELHYDMEKLKVEKGYELW